jgi:hypothetical protein
MSYLDIALDIENIFFLKLTKNAESNFESKSYMLKKFKKGSIVSYLTINIKEGGDSKI